MKTTEAISDDQNDNGLAGKMCNCYPKHKQVEDNELFVNEKCRDESYENQRGCDNDGIPR